jgi:hypothetical protein
LLIYRTFMTVPMTAYPILRPFVSSAAFSKKGSKLPFAAFAHRKNWIAAMSVRFLQIANLVCGRSEGPQSV